MGKFKSLYNVVRGTSDTAHQLQLRMVFRQRVCPDPIQSLHLPGRHSAGDSGQGWSPHRAARFQCYAEGDVAGGLSW